MKTTEQEQKKPLAKGLSQLFGALVGVWALSFYILPALTHSNSNIQQLADFIDFAEIDTGMFYYTDLDIVATADLGARSTIEYFGDK